MKNPSSKKKILILGGGFGGVRAALDLEKKVGAQAEITLVSNAPHFEYTPALYRVVTGQSPLEVCVPLREIFEKKNVRVIRDTIISLAPQKNTIAGISGSKYSYDYLIVALGSETEYFGIPGLKELSFGFKTITEALRLKRHLHEVFAECAGSAKAPERSEQKTKKLYSAHIVIVGAGPSGTELASELALYCKALAAKHSVDSSLVTVDLIEAGSRILPMLPEKFSKKIESRLRSFGVNIYTNREVIREKIEDLYMKDMQLKTKTVVWAAGIRAHTIGERSEGVALSKRKRILVDQYLRLQGYHNVFVIGDLAETQYSGLAQTALREGRKTAENIAREIVGINRGYAPGKLLRPHAPKKPFYLVPAGSKWTGAIIGPITVYGKIGWLLRRAADLRFFLSILPLKKAWVAFHKNKTLCEACEICTQE